MGKLTVLDWVVVALVALGLLAVGCGVVLERTFATHIGFTLWWIAFSAVVVENYRSGRPVQTRAGIVRKESGAVRYALPYVGLWIAIALAGFMLFEAWLMP